MGKVQRKLDETCIQQTKSLDEYRSNGREKGETSSLSGLTNRSKKVAGRGQTLTILKANRTTIGLYEPKAAKYGRPDVFAADFL